MKINVNKEDIEKFNNSEVGKRKNVYFKRVTIVGILLIRFSLSWILLNIINEISNTFELVSAIICILMGIFFIFNSRRLKLKEVNKFIYEKKSLKK